MDMSVIVCTYNRSASLGLCLEHLSAQGVPFGLAWEVVVVDNNSTDETPEVVRLFATEGRIPVRLVREERQGLCFARNRGLSESSGEIVAYLDDDILTEPGWLEGMSAVFRETGCDAAGGRIHLETGGRPLPAWLVPAMWGYLGHIDHGDRRIALDGKRHYPHGGNMAIRREAFVRIGAFNVGIGRSGSKLYKGSETEFFHRLAPTGAKIFYEPNARVRHVVKPGELTKRHFRALQVRDGEQKARQESPGRARTFMGVPLYLGRETGKAFLNYVRAFRRGPGARFRREMDLWWMAGFAWDCFRNRRQADAHAPVCRMIGPSDVD